MALLGIMFLRVSQLIGRCNIMTIFNIRSLKDIQTQRIKCCYQKLINNRVMGRLFNCLINGIYITCSMYYEFKSLEEKESR